MFNRCGYGVDLRDGQARVVTARRAGGRIVHESVPGELAANAPPHRVAAALPAAEGFLRVLPAPLPSERKSRAVLPSLLDVKLPFPLEDCACVFLAAAHAKGPPAAYVAAGGRLPDVRRRLELLAQVGLQPGILEHEALPLWSQAALEVPAMRRATTTVLLQLMPDRITLIHGSSEGLRGCATLRATDPAGLSRLLRTAVAPTGSGVLCVLAGTGATDPAAAEPARVTLTAWGATEIVVPVDPGDLLARGLATRALGSDGEDANLRTGALAHPRAAHHRLRVLYAPVLAAAVIGLGTLVTGHQVAARAQSSRVTELDRRIAEQAHRLAGYAVPGKGEQMLKAVEQKLAAQGRELSGLAEWAAGSRLPGYIATVVGACKDLQVDVHELRGEGTGITIKASGADVDAGAALQRRLLDAGLRADLRASRAGSGSLHEFQMEVSARDLP